MNKPPNTKSSKSLLDKVPNVKPEFNERSPPRVKPDSPQKHTLDLKPPVRVPTPPAPAPGGLSNEAQIGVKTHQMEKFELKKKKREADKKLIQEKKISRLFGRAAGREH